jgi:hypothetical protein
VGLLSASKQRPSELTDEVTATAAAVAAVLLVAAHNGIHRKALSASLALPARFIPSVSYPEPTSAISRLAMAAHPSCAVARLWTQSTVRFVVRVYWLCGRAAVRAAADGSFAGGQVPLRHTRADLYVWLGQYGT